MSQIAFIFPGQGSQYVGMGQDFYQSDPKARDLCHLAEETTGLSLRRLIFHGPMEELTETVNLQPIVDRVEGVIFLEVFK